MAILRFAYFLGIACVFSISAYGQEEETSSYHRLSLAMSHAHIPSGVKGDSKKWLALPAFSFDYDYWLNRKWALGLHTDVILENFLVKSSGDKEIERTKPVALAAVAIFKPGEHLSFLFGSGVEIAEEGSLFLIRFGGEYGWEINERWELGLSLMYDAKWDSYDTWVLGLGVSRILGKE